MIHPVRKLPRGRLYFDPVQVAIRTAQYAARPLRAGAAVAQLESRICQLLGCAHAVALPHARVALWLVFQQLELPPGAEVLTTPVTVPEVIAAIELAGLRPRFVDLGEHSGQMDAVALAAQVRLVVGVLLIVHLCGALADMDAIRTVAERHGLPIIEDASQAMGARWRGRAAGTLGRAGVFSISSLKPVSSFHGGLLVTDDAALAGRVRAVASRFPLRRRRTVIPWLARDYSVYVATRPVVFDALGWPLLRRLERHAPGAIQAFQRGRLWPSADTPGVVRRRSEVPGHWRLRYSDYQARVALDALERFEAQAERRRALSKRLLDGLAARGVSGLPRLHGPSEPLFWRVPVWVDDLASTRRALARRGIDSATTNLCCCSREAPFAHLAAATPHAEAFVDRALFLPLHPSLRPCDMDRVAGALGDLQARRRPRGTA